jgi:hypothetical protein
MAAVFAIVVSLMLSAPQGERVPDAAVVNGVPQGMFVGRSLLTGRAVCLLFLSGGRITRFIPEGGLEHFDWNRHRVAHGPDSGTWQIRGGQLAVTWGDGGVQQGPVTVHPDGIEFYGKRYSTPQLVDLAAIAGRWESARGSAIAGGAGISKVSQLVIAADGRYQWVSTIGGAVEGRAVAGDRSMSGTVAVRGLTIVFRSDTGTTSSHTLLPAAGRPVSAFSLDSDMFTRSGPGPATIAPPTSGPSPAASAPPAKPAPGTATPAPVHSYQGLAFTLPAGWTTSMQQGRFVVAPASQPAEGVVFVVLYGADGLAGSFEEWLRAKMTADLGATLRVLQAPPPTRGKVGGFDVLSAARTVQDQRDGSARALLQLYYGISDSRQAGLAMAATTSEAALKAELPTVQAIFQSLGLDNAGTSSSTPAAPGGGSSGATTPAQLVGHWEHSGSNRVAFASATSPRGYGQGYTFNADGTYTYFFSGTIDERTRLTESDSGAWGIEGGYLVIRSGERRSVKTFQIIQLESAADGSGSLTLLDRAYQPTSSNINVWGEKYVKKAK